MRFLIVLGILREFTTDLDGCYNNTLLIYGMRSAIGHRHIYSELKYILLVMFISLINEVGRNRKWANGD